MKTKKTFFKRLASRIVSFTSVLLIFSLLAFTLSSCAPKPTEETFNIISLDKIDNIPEESLYIEWLGNTGYNADKRTMILIHGETPEQWDSKFSMTLSNDDYIYYSQNSTYYNIETGIDLDRDLHKYWLNQGYNVGIFHYEKFADDSLDKLSQKLFNNVSMRYKTESGYKNTNTPNYSLTEILAAVYINQIPKEAYGNEIRLIGNGIGANLALSLSDYLYTFYERGAVRGEILPQRLSLIDPYLSPVKFNNNIDWKSYDTSLSMLEITNKMLNYTTSRGLVAEIIENVEVTAEEVAGVSVEKLVSPYEYQLNEEQKLIKKSIKEKVAYLLLRQKYAILYSDNYREQNRAGLDWYLYSIIGSDDTKIGAPGYVTPDYDSTYCNWGKFNTRPMMNDRVRNNNSSGGKNYAISAWTETVWTRALRGIEFTMQQSTGQMKDDTGDFVRDMHDNYVYNYKDFTLTRFRSENYQIAENMNRTIVAGYIWNDKNEDRVMNEGIGSYLGGMTVNVSLSTSVSGETEVIKTLSVVTEKDGFYMVKFDNSFKNNHTVTVTVIPPNSSYHVQTAALNTYHVADLPKHSFNKNTKSITISRYYGNAITIANCGMVIR